MKKQNIAPRTRTKLEDTIRNNYHLGVGNMADAIARSFRVLDASAQDRPKQPSPKPGQVWRNRTSGRLVKVLPWTGMLRDVEWECIGGTRGPRRGSRWHMYFDESFDYVRESE